MYLGRMRIFHHCMGYGIEVVEEMMWQGEGCVHWSFLASDQTTLHLSYWFISICLTLVALQILICVSSSDEEESIYSIMHVRCIRRYKKIDWYNFIGKKRLETLRYLFASGNGGLELKLLKWLWWEIDTCMRGFCNNEW